MMNSLDATFDFEHMATTAEELLGEQVDLSWSSRSHFSVIGCFRSVRNQCGLVIKDLMPWHLESMKETDRLETANHFNAATSHFRQLLIYHDVPVARRYHCCIRDGKPLHVSSEEGIAADAAIAAACAQEQVQIVGAIIKAIAGALQQSDPPVIGLDAQLANFGVSRNGNGPTVTYIDVFPPLCHYRGEYLVHYPNPNEPHKVALEIERKFKPFGILRRLRFSILSVDLALEPVFLHQLQRHLPDLFGPVSDFFESLPDAAIRNGYNRKRVCSHIENIPDGDIDAIREVGVRLAHKQTTPRHEFINRVFDLSRIDPSPGYEAPHEVRFNQLKTELVALATT